MDIVLGAAAAAQGGMQICPIKSTNLLFRGVSDGGAPAQSGHSDHTTAQQAGTALAPLEQRQPDSPDSVVTAAAPEPASPAVVQLPALSPLPPPDASEGPEAAAEYEVYLQRWDAGDTLAQRWHRLAQKGKLQDIEAEYEDWQMDVTLEQVRARAAQAGPAQQHNKPGGATNPSNNGAAAGSRLRRGRVELEGSTDCVAGEPRKVRSRRAPSTLQDYHVENSRTPDRQDTEATAAAMAAAGGGGNGSSSAGMQQQQQQQPGGPQKQHQQQHPVAIQHPSLLLQQPMTATALQQQMQQQQWQLNRTNLPHNSTALLQHQQQQQAQAQARLQQQQQAMQVQQARLQQQQLQQQVMQQQAMQQQGGMAGQQRNLQQQQQGVPQIPPEVTEQWYKIGTSLGSLMQERGGPANWLTNPQAMCALVGSVLKQATGDADVAMQQLVATMQGAGRAL